MFNNRPKLQANGLHLADMADWIGRLNLVNISHVVMLNYVSLSLQT